MVHCNSHQTEFCPLELPFEEITIIKTAIRPSEANMEVQSKFCAGVASVGHNMNKLDVWLAWATALSNVLRVRAKVQTMRMRRVMSANTQVVRK